MKYALNLASDGRILTATFAKYAPSDAVLVDTLPDGNITDYLYQEHISMILFLNLKLVLENRFLN